MAQTDSDGYSYGSPDSLKIVVIDWEDGPNNWNPPDQQDWTNQIFEGYAVLVNSPSYKAAHPGYDSSKDPLYGFGTGFLRRLMEMNYQDRVTGANFQEISGEVSTMIRNKLNKLQPISDTDWLPGYYLSLSTSGDYWAQLASRVPGDPTLFEPDPNGDVLRLKYITHGNWVKFEVGLNFVGQQFDPIAAVSTDGPSFTVYFDTIATIDLQLPHNYRDTLKVLSAVVHISGADLHPENYQGVLAAGVIKNTVQDDVNAYEKDFTDKIQGKLQGVNSLLGALPAFDQAEYSVDPADANDTTLTATFTQHPTREYDVRIDHLEGQFSRGPVQNYVTVQIGLHEAATEVVAAPGYFLPVVRTYAPTAPPEPTFGDGSRYVVIQVAVLRRIVEKPVGGKLVDEGGDWHAVYYDGVDVDLGPNFNPNDPMALRALFPRHDTPLPGIKQGLLETNEVFVDYATQYVSGRYPDNSIYKIKASPVAGEPGSYAAQISIPGTKDIPQVQFTITMSGTRNGTVPDETPPNPPRREVGEHRAAFRSPSTGHRLDQRNAR